jgi:hypothetical protein
MTTALALTVALLPALAAAQTIEFSTYLGGRKIYVAGSTNSENFPVTNARQSALRGPQDAFVLKIDPAR